MSSNINKIVSAPMTEATTNSPPVMTLRDGKTKTLLPADFKPSEFSVICGNKRSFFTSAGNRRFRLICKMHLAEFQNAPSKHEKSCVVTKVMRIIHTACPVGAFVSFDNGRWWEVSHRAQREKVGTHFRDLLGDKYKSSTKNKVAQRKQKRTQCAPAKSQLRPNRTASMPTMKQVMAAKFLPITSIECNPLQNQPFSAPTSPVALPTATIVHPASAPNLRTAVHTIPPKIPLAVPGTATPPLLDPALCTLPPLQGLSNDLAMKVLAELEMTDLTTSDDLEPHALSEDPLSECSTGAFYDIDDLTLASL